MKYLVTVDGHTYTIEINQDDRVSIDGQEQPLDFTSTEGSLYSLLLAHCSYEAFVEEHEGVQHVLLQGVLYDVSVQDEERSRLLGSSHGFAPPSGEIAVQAPMPGLIVAVPVSEGEAVTAGQNLVILESMKMENELKAPRAGTVARVRVKPKEHVEKGQTLVVLA